MKETAKRISNEQALRKYLSQHRMRCTPERIALLGAASRIDGQFTAAQLLEAILAEGFQTTAATVYNTLRLFVNAGVVRSRSSQGTTTKYEYAAGVDQRIQWVCTKCGRSKQLQDAEVGRLLGLKRYNGFVATGFELIIRGTCSRCRSGGRRKRK